MIDPNSLGFLINDIARLMRATFEREIVAAELSVTAAEARVLAHMARCGAIRQNLLAERLGMTPMSVTGFLDRLERADLIHRGADPEDRRAKIVTLTEKAHGLLNQIAGAGEKARDKALAGLSVQERDLFKSLGLRVRDTLLAARTLQGSVEEPA